MYCVTTGGCLGGLIASTTPCLSDQLTTNSKRISVAAAQPGFKGAIRDTDENNHLGKWAYACCRVRQVRANRMA